MRWTRFFWLLFAGLQVSSLVAAAPKKPKEQITVDCLQNRAIQEKSSEFAPRFCLHRNVQNRLTLAAIDSQNILLDHVVINTSLALTLLTNPNAKPLHDALLAEAGGGLEKLRAEELQAVKKKDFNLQGNQNSLIPLNSNRIGAFIVTVGELSKLGYVEQALAGFAPLLDKYEKKDAERAKEGRMLSLDDQWQWFSLRSTYNNILMNRGDYEKGMPLYYALAADPRMRSEYRLNAKVNIAAYLAENRQYEEALKTIEEAYTQFNGTRTDPRDFKLGGSDRHFSWIKACALNGLGKVDEAQPYIDAVLAHPEKPYEPYTDIFATSSIEQRMNICLRNVDRYAAMLNKYPSTFLFGSPVSLALQPGADRKKVHQNEFFARLREHPAMKAKADEYLLLSDDLLPALNGWR
jgi:tetratricopeptide (TPR) repeat protein